MIRAREEAPANLWARGPDPDALTLEAVSTLDSVRADWARLAEQTGNVFLTWEWADAWQRQLSSDSELAVGLGRDASGRVRVVLPLYLSRRAPVRVLRFVGAGPADELGPVCRAQDRAVAAHLLRRHVGLNLGDGGVFLGERLSATSGIGAELGAVEVATAATPVLGIQDDSFERYLTTRSRNFRSQARRAERRLVREHRLAYRMTESPDELERDLDVLMDLHESRWQNGQSQAFAPPQAAFHRDFARRALERGWLRLWTLELDGRPAAVWYGLRFGGADHYYQAGRDPAFSALKVGFVLLCHTIRCAFEDGMREYRFGLGGEAYKDRFTGEDPGLQTVALSRGLRGHLALGSLRTAVALRDRARRLRSGDSQSPWPGYSGWPRESA